MMTGFCGSQPDFAILREKSTTLRPRVSLHSDMISTSGGQLLVRHADFNPSNAVATFLQNMRMQNYLKNI